MGAQGNAIPLDLLGGRLEGISFPELLWGLCRAGSTGVLEIQHGGWRKRLFVEKGRVVFATSSNPDDRLGETLLREGWITLDQLERAVEGLGSGRRLGTLLVEQGAITPHDLVQCVVMQVKRIVLDLFLVEEGAYRFHEGSLPSDELITLGMRTGDLLLEGMRRVRSFMRMRRAVGPPGTRYRLSENWQAALEGLELSAGERSLLQHLDTQGRSVEALCRDALLSNFETYQTLWAFRILGAVEEVERDPTVEHALQHGPIGRDGLLPVIIDLCRQGREGVLYATRGSVERALYIRDGRCVFARSGSLDDGLVAHLLRRGVISLEDREEVGKRLLSNKRVGQILHEMGVLTPDELVDVVREQLREIVLDCLTWDEGFYAFVPEALPTREEITLDWSLEDLVLAATRRIVSWSRVARGCGLDEGPLALTPSYLDVLDRMEVGDEEWQIVAALREPAEVRAVCRNRELPVFRVCQTLWALRLLGALAPAAELPAGAPADVETGPAGDGEEEAEREPAATPAVGAGAPAEASPGNAAPAVPEGEAPVVAEPIGSGSEAWAGGSTAAPGVVPDRTAAESASPAATLNLSRDFVDAACAGEGAPWEEPAAQPAAEFPSPESTGSGGDGSEREAERLEREGGETAFRAAGAAQPQEETCAEDVAATARLSAEEIAAALVSEAAGWQQPQQRQATGEAEVRGDAAGAGEQPEGRAEAAAEAPPENLEELIERFNDMQRVLFRSIRSEIGAGAFNFVRSCGGRVEGTLFARVGLQPDGAWDPQGLKQAVIETGMREPWTCFERLIEEELRRLEVHLGEARVAGLRERLAGAARHDRLNL